MPVRKRPQGITARDHQIAERGKKIKGRVAIIKEILEPQENYEWEPRKKVFWPKKNRNTSAPFPK